ncbi:MAG TPA: 4Fe-4S ferredoxin [Clostridiales bacterium]|nr:4Fe-4S ferredoxin [Clostridiales bacterium]
MRKLVVADPELCYGCRTCEMVCSLHLTGAFRPGASGIHRHTLVDDLGFTAVSCLHCADPLCLRACPVGAITRDDKGTVTIDRSACVGCLTCALVCPVGAVSVVDGRPVKCDLCGGEPLCAKWCPHEALSVVDAAEVGLERRRSFAEHVSRSARQATGGRYPGGA